MSVPDPVPVLTSELQSTLQDRIEKVLTRIINANLHTRYVQESPVFADFRDSIECLSNDLEARDKVLLESFRTVVPLTTYASHEPFISKFLEQPCMEDDVKNLFAPGLPNFIAPSSATSGKAPKFFARYRHPPGVDRVDIPISKDGGKTCALFSLVSHRLLEIRGDADKETTIPITLVSSGGIRMRHDLGVDKDPLLMKLTMPANTSPLAVSFLRNYRSFLLMHALFALADAKLEIMFMTLSTIFVDLVRYMEEEWVTLVTCVETGELPDYEGVDEIRQYLEAGSSPKLPPNPARAAELRAIGVATDTPGRLVKVWPGFKTVVAVASGLFASALPKMRHYLGPTVLIRSLGLIASEGYVGLVYNPSELNLFKAVSDDVVEYLDVSLDETAASLVPAWELQLGHRYEIVLTTRDGLWRYRLDDIIEVAGFDPSDGTPILKYVERRNVVARPGGIETAGKTLADAIFGTQATLGKIVEFTVVNDERVMPPCLGYLVEIEGAISPNAHTALQQLHDNLYHANDNLQHALDDGRVGPPTVRILNPGTFREFREWKIGLANSGVGQMKVPVVLSDETAVRWVLERVVQEI
ncbi:hypothetical protein BV22DRAFT_1134818 [Leucogyrophana mollusca]|uniref:Uncharacterized protein n=1 Tax=Leucogyrophana mollusca TaxID=85980 RepID=A0ACB8AYW3_9AGAM|nr:hypothetical protein BV22DRAFT_1134818 [Leucogyrophana mollusca]